MSEPENTQPPRGSAAHELNAVNIALRALEGTVRVLDNQREAMTKTADEMRLDVRDMRDRMARLETKVDGLPTKDWIGGVVSKSITTTATIVGVIATILGGVVALIHYVH